MVSHRRLQSITQIVPARHGWSTPASPLRRHPHRRPNPYPLLRCRKPSARNRRSRSILAAPSLRPADLWTSLLSSGLSTPATREERISSPSPSATPSLDILQRIVLPRRTRASA